MKKNCKWVLLIGACLCAFSPLASAGTVTATSEASELLPNHFGDGIDYYRYTITLDWDYSELGAGSGSGLSHFDLDLTTTLLCDYALEDPEGDPTNKIRFENKKTYQLDTDNDGILETYYYTTGIDGASNSEEYPLIYDSVQWGGTTDSGLLNTLRYHQPLEDDPLVPDPAKTEYSPGNVGQGEFHFYSVWGPVESTGGVTLKMGLTEYSHSDALVGELPYCVPEPATLALLGLGALVLRRKK